MSYQRAAWSSGLTYRQTCRMCKTKLQYTDDALNFRPWYADGFVYCPRCGTPLRHNEAYSINAPQTPVEIMPQPQGQFVEENAELARFCAVCGNPYAPNDRFCAVCGTKR